MAITDSNSTLSSTKIKFKTAQRIDIYGGGGGTHRRRDCSDDGSSHSSDSSSTVSDGDALGPNPDRGSDCRALVPFKKRKIENRDSDWKRFECVTCNRSFSSFQALGGHRSSHSKVRVVGKSKGEDGEEGGHRCKICYKSFPSGQALGGHQKRHWWVRPSSTSVSTPQPQIASACLFDLNEIASFENEQDAISFLS